MPLPPDQKMDLKMGPLEMTPPKGQTHLVKDGRNDRDVWQVRASRGRVIADQHIALMQAVRFALSLGPAAHQAHATSGCHPQRPSSCFATL